MPAESAADRSAFLSTDDFGDEAAYTPSGGSPVMLTGILNSPHLNVQLNDVPVSDSAPTFLCRSADLPNGARGGDAGDTLAIGSTTYRVTDLQPDGTGMTLLTLGRQS